MCTEHQGGRLERTITQASQDPAGCGHRRNKLQVQGRHHGRMSVAGKPWIGEGKTMGLGLDVLNWGITWATRRHWTAWSKKGHRPAGSWC